MKQKDGWQNFLNACQKAGDYKSLDAFFKFIFTADEVKQLATRMLLIQHLLRGDMTQREIAKTYNVSIAKITRGSNALKLLDEHVKKQLLTIFTPSGKK